MSHSLWVFIGERRGKAASFAFTATRIRWRALRLRLLGQSLDWLWLVRLLAVAVLFSLTPLVGQLSILRGSGHLVGLFHLEEHRRGRTVLHGSEFTESTRTILISPQYNYNKRVMVIWSALTFSLCWIWLDSFETLSPHLWAPRWPCLGGSTVCASADAPLLQTLPRSTGSCDSASHLLWPDVNTDRRN